jgi:hypothetical protein
VIAHACNTNTWEAEAGGLQVLGPPELHNEVDSVSKHQCYKKRKRLI